MLKDGQKGVIRQRSGHHFAVTPHIPAGMPTSDDLRRIADIADKYNAHGLKITTHGRISIIGIRQEDIDKVWQELDMPVGYETGAKVLSVKTCTGGDFCKAAMRKTLDLAKKLDEKYTGTDMPDRFCIGVSGCIEECEETFIKDIGIVGTTRGWKIYAGGRGGPKPAIAKEIASELNDPEVFNAVDRIINFYKKNAKNLESLSSVINRAGPDEFKRQTVSDL